jgi:hypothetical protein
MGQSQEFVGLVEDIEEELDVNVEESEQQTEEGSAIE